MTWEELIAKAEGHAKAIGIPLDRLQKPKVRETALVTFTGKSADSQVRFHLDAATGELITFKLSGPEFDRKVAGQPLSKRAQRVLAQASDEAKRLKREHVGSDHLLLALLVYGQGAGPSALTSAGLAAEAVRRRLETIGSSAEVATNGYTPSMRAILRLSSDKASQTSEIEPEHLLLAILDKADGPAMSLLRHFKVNLEQVRASLLKQMQ